MGKTSRLAERPKTRLDRGMGRPHQTPHPWARVRYPYLIRSPAHPPGKTRAAYPCRILSAFAVAASSAAMTAAENPAFSAASNPAQVVPR